MQYIPNILFAILLIIGIGFFGALTTFSTFSLSSETFNKTAKVAIGERAAVAFLDNQTVLRHYGKLVFMGDSITQGGNGDHPSYRYEVFRHLATKSVPIDANAGYKFTGSVTGSYRNDTVTTPDINGQVFENVHEGHFGWRAFWENGRIALPSTRRSLNRGEGTILNWTGQASPQEYDLNSLGNKVAYPNATASSGNTGTTYIPDTLVILIGINDLGDAPHDVLLVLDGSTGQNAFEQAKQFTAATEVTSLAVTKLDGTAKGGVVIGISDQFKIPVKYIGVGEGIEDLQVFNKFEFVDSFFK